MPLLTTDASVHDDPEVSRIQICVTLKDDLKTKPSRVILERTVAKWLVTNGFSYIEHELTNS